MSPAVPHLFTSRSLPRAFAVLATLCLFACLRAVPLAPQPLHLASEVNYVEHPDFLWSAVDGATAYEFQLATAADFARPVLSDRVEIARFVPLQPLAPGEHFWRVRAFDAAGAAGPWSATQRYTLRAPAKTFSVSASADLAEMRRILAEAVSAAPARVEFAAGATYRVKPDDAVLSILKARDLIVDGRDSLIVIENPSAGFLRMDECQRVTVRGFRVDYDPLPHAVGRVEAIDLTNKSAPAVLLRSEPGYPDFDAPHVKENSIWGVVLDSAPERRGWMKAGSPLVFRVTAPKVTRTDDGAFRLPLPSATQAATLERDDRLIIFARNKTKAFAGVSRSTDVTFDHIIAYAAPAGHFSFTSGTRLKVLSSGSRRRDDTRWFAGNADGVHVRASAIGPWIEGCTFEAVGDDAIALYNKGIFVQEQLSPTSVQVAREFADLEVGEVFRLFNPRAGELIGGLFTATRVTRGSGDVAIEFTPALPDGVQLVTNAEPRTHSDQLFNYSKRNALFMVRNNTFTGIRRFGTVFRSPDGAVKSNRYTGISNAAITTLNEPDSWHNGLASQRVVIADNIIERSAFDGSSTNVGSIHILLRKLGHAVAPARPFEHIVITGNTVIDWSQRGISLQSAEHSRIENNTVRSTLPNFPFIANGEHYAIFTDNVRSTRVAHNDVTGETRAVTTLLRLDEDASNTVNSNRTP